MIEFYDRISSEIVICIAFFFFICCYRKAMEASKAWCLVLQNIKEHNLRLFLFKIKPFLSVLLSESSCHSEKQTKSSQYSLSY